MRMINGKDVRYVLQHEKCFSKRPLPLEQFLYTLNLSRTAERVFWLHWDLSQYSNDYTSKISLKAVAERLDVHTSSITRAYQQLIHFGLIARYESGRCSDNPFLQEVSITEILPLGSSAIASKLITGIQCSRDRSKGKVAGSTPSEQKPEVRLQPDGHHPGAIEGTAPVAEGNPELAEVFFKEHGPRHVFAAATRDMSPTELARFNELLRQPLTQRTSPWAREPASKIGESANAWIVRHLTRLTETALTNQPIPTRAPRTIPSRPRLSTLSLTYLRSYLARYASGQDLDRVVMEASWSILHGSFAKFESTRHAIHSIGKLVQAGKWNRPNKMPPHWVVAAEVSGLCSAA